MDHARCLALHTLSSRHSQIAFDLRCPAHSTHHTLAYWPGCTADGASHLINPCALTHAFCPAERAKPHFFFGVLVCARQTPTTRLWPLHFPPNHSLLERRGRGSALTLMSHRAERAIRAPRRVRGSVYYNPHHTNSCGLSRFPHLRKHIRCQVDNRAY